VNNQTDSQLLRAYVEQCAEPAFAELVRRHVDFVYSAAQRMVCDSHLAEDVTQNVFVALAKQAPQLAARPVLSGWLHCTAQNIAAQTVRADVRRRAREQEAVAMNELLADESDANWEQIAPHLDAALGELSESDRDALLLRYFERKSAQEMAQTLGISDTAAQKRVSRAVERLREFFSKRNVPTGANGLVVLISANAVQAAPVGLGATISTIVTLNGTVFHTSTLIAVTKTIAMKTFQKTLYNAALIVVAGTGIYQAHQASTLRAQVQNLQEQQVPLAEQLQQLQRDRDDATNRLAVMTEELTQLKKNPSEVLKLRGEVGALRTAKAIAGSQSPLNKITANPASRKALRDQQKIGMSAIYSDLAKRLNLTPEQTGQFNDLMADNVMDSIDLITQALHDNRSRSDIDQLFSVQNSALQDKLQALIGPDGLAQYLDYTKNLGSTLTAAQFAGSLTGDPATIADKKSQLLQAIQNATQSALAAAGLPADYQTVPILNFANIASNEEAAQSLQLLDNIYGQVAANASTFLNADELNKFQEFRTNAIQTSQTMLVMNRNMMEPIAK
jgi:RNA polymerase sigma factor (sigma-70 family)